MLILDCGDKGVRTLRNVEGIVVKRVRDWETFEQVYWYLLKNPKEYKTVSIDTATQLQNLAVNKILVEAGKSTENAGDWGTLSQENWGEVSALLKAWITSYCDLAASEEEGGIGLDVVWLAQLRIEEVEQDDPEVEIEPDAGPAIIPSVSQHLQDQCSVIGNTFIRIKRKEIKRRGKTLIREKPQYCMRIGPNPVYRTKLRTDPETAVPEYLVDPTYEDIHALMEGE